MDEIDPAKPKRVQAPAFEDRHPVLHPQHRLRAIELGKQETRPAAVARVRREQLGESGMRRSR